ncbi:sulfur carrier protein ThiS [Rothia similmucilaginosa]|uniref:sulfur carrier protein ThiS n=1 Tax=Rothia sp. RSM42 TaxID=3030211 RepID=UPI00244B9285|nr:sulfur carrier protein ThiS [Rothia sp. RSM42]
MTITYNGELLTTNTATVFDLVMEQFGTDAGVAVALNRSILPRSAWKNSVLNDGDRVDALTAVQGG